MGRRESAGMKKWMKIRGFELRDIIYDVNGLTIRSIVKERN